PADRSYSGDGRTPCARCNPSPDAPAATAPRPSGEQTSASTGSRRRWHDFAYSGRHSTQATTEQRFENHLLDLGESGSAIEVSQSESQCTKNLHYLTGRLERCRTRGTDPLSSRLMW